MIFKHTKNINFIFFIIFACINLYLSASDNIMVNKPRVSIITSIWNGDKFIEGFFKDILQLSIFKECELILINANSPGHEEKIIKKYTSKYSNIRYIKLDNDPGLYAVWNIGIKMANADLITNANLDDRHNPLFLKKQVNALESDASLDLVYANFYYTKIPNSEFKTKCNLSTPYTLLRVPEFSPSIRGCYQGPHPVWRKSMHDRCGYFDESFYSSGDWEMWCRAISCGSLFKKIPGISGVYYFNPQGISTNNDSEKSKKRNAENQWIISKYGYMWE